MKNERVRVKVGWKRRKNRVRGMRGGGGDGGRRESVGGCENEGVSVEVVGCGMKG